jgi:uncharacterized protein DUF1496
MRIPASRFWLPALALVAFACGPHTYHYGMAMKCGPSACWYQGRCFSEGAVRSNDGVCQTCTAEKWTAATGCRDCACHECGGRVGTSTPCPHHERH